MELILGIVVLVFAIGFFVRAARYFERQKDQNAEIIDVLKEIRDKL